MKVAIVFPEHPGCRHDAEVLRAALAPAVHTDRDTILAHPVPEEAVYWKRELTESRISVGDAPDCVFFIEGLIDHSVLLSARHRILLPNPEWLEADFAHLAAHCDYFWHKSRASIDLLAPSYPNAQHVFVGFTSHDPGVRVSNYASFLHPRGHIGTRRNTETVLESWNARPDWPALHVHFHSGPLNLSRPIVLANHRIRLRSGWIDSSDYFKLAAEHGMHLCTSEAEGFGHYINEARALAAVIVTTDAPPMNELVDVESGVLVPPSSRLPFNSGFRYLIDACNFTAAIDWLADSELTTRHRLAEAALHRFNHERNLFHKRVVDAFEQLAS